MVKEGGETLLYICAFFDAGSQGNRLFLQF